MKNFIVRFGLTLVVGVLTFMGTLPDARAQVPDTLDVTPGFVGSLNVAILGDTTATGERLNPHRVYRLERGGYYLLEGSIQNPGGFHLTIVAAEGDGHPPLLIPAVDDLGVGVRAFTITGDLTLKGLYISGLTQLGSQLDTKNMIRPEADGARIIVDNCFLDHEQQSFVRFNAREQKLYMTNTTARNSNTIPGLSNGRIFDTRGNLVDSIFVQNCTFYHFASNAIRDGGGIIKNLIWDHNTVYNSGGGLQITRAINAQITNNLFINMSFEGDIVTGDPADSLAIEIIPIDSLRSPLASEADRRIYILDNNFGFTPELLAFYDSNDTVDAAVVHNARTQRFIDTNPYIKSERNISENPEFGDLPNTRLVIDMLAHLLQGLPEANTPDFRADRNGMGDDLVNNFGIETDPFDFDYPTSKQSYTHAAGRFPLGDLNWFPDKKAEWIAAGMPTRVEEGGTRTPVAFELKQNYPNPFSQIQRFAGNPSTTIIYSLEKSAEVQLEIYNLMGQKVRSLVNGKKATGTYTVTWDGRSDNGVLLPSGIYFYRMQANSQSLMRKMVLVR